MPQTLSSMSRRNQIALVCAGLLLVAIIGYFALISPKRSEASDLKAQTASVQVQIDRNKMSPYAKALPAVRAATVYRLAQAMPDDVAMADVILELNKIAEDSGITFYENSEKKFPYISATLTIDAFVVGKGTSAAQPTATETTSTSTTPTSTTPTTTTTPSGASAAPGTTP